MHRSCCVTRFAAMSSWADSRPAEPAAPPACARTGESPRISEGTRTGGAEFSREPPPPPALCGAPPSPAALLFLFVFF